MFNWYYALGFHLSYYLDGFEIMPCIVWVRLCGCLDSLAHNFFHDHNFIRFSAHAYYLDSLTHNLDLAVAFSLYLLPRSICMFEGGRENMHKHMLRCKHGHVSNI